MSGKLYVVGTPIGNLGDLSPRALETLNAVDFIAAEDTRVSLKLLSRFDVHKPLVSYHEHNQRDRGEMIVGRLIAGESCAVITDAGMPCISDPGEDLVRRCAECGIETVVVPGPSAVISALALSGLSVQRFSFEGFLSTQKNNRKQHLAEIKNDTRTLVFYEAPHKLMATLEDLLAALGDRKISLGRELTKLHEEVLRTTLSEAVDFYKTNPPRGEFVLVIEGAAPVEEEQPTLEEAAALVKKLQQDGMSLSNAAKEAANVTGYSRGELYRLAVKSE
jgi:16S rRNA (cytidine1402-2'-O)-methyltransferase